MGTGGVLRLLGQRTADFPACDEVLGAGTSYGGCESPLRGVLCAHRGKHTRSVEVRNCVCTLPLSAPWDTVKHSVLQQPVLMGGGG